MPLSLSFASLSFLNLKLSRNAKLLLGLLAGLSLSILATGYLLSKQRRRYRAISTTSSDHVPSSSSSSLQRTSTFRMNDTPTPTPTPFHSMTGSRHVGFSRKDPAPLSLGSESSTHSSVSETLVPQEGVNGEFFASSTENPCGHSDDFSDGMGQSSIRVPSRLSESSDDSFHSTVETIEDVDISEVLPPRNGFYMTAMDQVNHGLVHCRTMRTKMLTCESDVDFLAKLYCIRLAFDELIKSQTDRNYFKQLGRDIMSSFLKNTGKDPALFCERYDNLTQFLEEEKNWTVAGSELRSRRPRSRLFPNFLLHTVQKITRREPGKSHHVHNEVVVCMNVYDIALDFVLMDAFNDLDNPPSTIVAVLQNTWITDGMKNSALSAAIWSLLKAKKSMLKHKGGFMAHFYLLSETISPTLVWGFLGTDVTLRERCLQFRAHILEFMRAIFTLESVRYTTVHTLADDVLRLAQHTAESMVVE